MTFRARLAVLVLAACLTGVGAAPGSGGPALASDDHATGQHDIPTEAAPPPPPAVTPPPPPPEEERQRARDAARLRDDAPASRKALDRARRNADLGVPEGRDRSLEAMSNEDFNQVLIGPRGQKIIIRESGSGLNTTRSITVMDNEVTSSQGPDSRACSSVGSIGDTPNCQ